MRNNVMVDLPNWKHSKELAFQGVNRCCECGLRGEQLPRAMEILNAGEWLLTWRMKDGRVFFMTGKEKKP